MLFMYIDNIVKDYIRTDLGHLVHEINFQGVEDENNIFYSYTIYFEEGEHQYSIPYSRIKEDFENDLIKNTLYRLN